MQFGRWLSTEWRRLVFNCVFAILNLVFVIVFYRTMFIAVLSLFVLAVLGHLVWRSLTTLALYLGGGIFGIFAEAISVRSGIWTYAVPSFWGVPLWLFFLWGSAASFLYQSGLEIKKLGATE